MASFEIDLDELLAEEVLFFDEPMHMCLPCRDGEEKHVGSVRCSPSAVERGEFGGSTDALPRDSLIEDDINVFSRWDYTGILCQEDSGEFTAIEPLYSDSTVWVALPIEYFEWGSETNSVVLYAPEEGLCMICKEYGEFDRIELREEDGSYIEYAEYRSLKFREVPDVTVVNALKGAYPSKIVARKV